MHKVPGPSMRGTFTQLPRQGWTTTATSTCFIASVSTSMHSYNRRWLAISGVGPRCFIMFHDGFGSLFAWNTGGWWKVFWTPRPKSASFQRAKSLEWISGNPRWDYFYQQHAKASYQHSTLRMFALSFWILWILPIFFPSIFMVSQKPRNKRSQLRKCFDHNSRGYAAMPHAQM